MKKSFLLIIILFAAMSQPGKAQSSVEQDIIGTWLSTAKDGKIEIYKSGSKYFGKLIWGKTILDANGNSKKDFNNADVKLRSREIRNAVILTDFIFNDDEWKDGKIYDPNSGKTYNSVMKIEDGKLKLRGYIGISLFGRTEIWTKIK